ncbi:ornithine carbamoyltransferase, catabolic domain protein [Carnobacterium maltaromaticum LMA28]|uniref:Ornithine carbamoyltransferase, catabolic domain protein n=1 Tax=Carnobacterium maltaromaticum LMA28 TaxID=1234679 RepID=K8EDC1_CARML|nr:ornithine carbamoyltransferase, catabolic domain protein [Carnobacterium maltaromaticum LMA28]
MMNESVFEGRSLLAEKDFTKEELTYLVDFSAHLKKLKKSWRSTSLFRRKKYCAII